MVCVMADSSSLERLQILVRPDQAALLRSTARQRGVPVARLVREALDHTLGTRSPAERRAAWERFDSLGVVPDGPDPLQLEGQLDDRASDHSWLAR